MPDRLYTRSKVPASSTTDQLLAELVSEVRGLRREQAGILRKELRRANSPTAMSIVRIIALLLIIGIAVAIIFF